MELTITGIIKENYFTWKKIIFKIEIFFQKKKKNLMKRYQYLEIYQHLDTQNFFPLKLAIKHSGYVNTDT